MKNLGLGSLISAVLEKLGMPGSTTSATETFTYTSEPHEVNDLQDLPPELADYPGVRKLFEEAQKRRTGLTGELVTSSAAPEESKSAAPIKTIKREHTHNASEIPPALTGNPAVRELVDRAKGSAVLFSAEHVISSDEAAKDPHLPEVLNDAERKLSSKLGLRVDLHPGAIKKPVVPKTVKASPVARDSKVLDWIMLLLFCLGLAFAITAVATLLKTTHVPR
jgi:hypothetical protein